MIARVWRGRTRSAHAAAYAKYVSETGVLHQRATPGNRGSMVFQRLIAGEVEFMVVSLWDTLDDVRNFAGEDVEAAVYFPEDKHYLLELEPRVEHFEVPVFEVD